MPELDWLLLFMCTAICRGHVWNPAFGCILTLQACSSGTAGDRDRLSWLSPVDWSLWQKWTQMARHLFKWVLEDVSGWWGMHIRDEEFQDFSGSCLGMTCTRGVCRSDFKKIHRAMIYQRHLTINETLFVSLCHRAVCLPVLQQCRAYKFTNVLHSSRKCCGKGAICGALVEASQG